MSTWFETIKLFKRVNWELMEFTKEMFLLVFDDDHVITLQLASHSNNLLV